MCNRRYAHATPKENGQADREGTVASIDGFFAEARRRCLHIEHSSIRGRNHPCDPPGCCRNAGRRAQQRKEGRVCCLFSKGESAYPACHEESHCVPKEKFDTKH